MIVYGSLHSLLDYECLFSFRESLGSDLRIGHLFTIFLTTESFIEVPYESRRSLILSLMLRPTVSWPVCLGINHPFGAYDQIFVSQTVAGLLMWAPSLTRGRVCRLQLLLAIINVVIFGSEARGTRDNILLSQIRDFSFRDLLRLAGLRWRYSTPPPHRILPNDWTLLNWSHFQANRI
jgi:hypothetical protein